MLDKDYTSVLRCDQPKEHGKVTRFMASDYVDWRQLMCLSTKEIIFFIKISINRDYGYAISNNSRNKSPVVRVSLSDRSEKVMLADLGSDPNCVVNFELWDTKIHAGISTALGTKILLLSKLLKIFTDLVK